MLLAFGVWELGALKYQREMSGSQVWQTPFGLPLVLLGAIAGGILWGLAPNARTESKARRFARWVVIMLFVTLPTAVADLLRAPSLATVAWTFAISGGLAMNAWFIEARVQPDSRE